jgi:hypothetical protein
MKSKFNRYFAIAACSVCTAQATQIEMKAVNDAVELVNLTGEEVRLGLPCKVVPRLKVHDFRTQTNVKGVPTPTANTGMREFVINAINLQQFASKMFGLRYGGGRGTRKRNAYVKTVAKAGKERSAKMQAIAMGLYDLTEGFGAGVLEFVRQQADGLPDDHPIRLVMYWMADDPIMYGFAGTIAAAMLVLEYEQLPSGQNVNPLIFLRYLAETPRKCTELITAGMWHRAL